MSRINPVNPEHTDAKAAARLQVVKRRLGGLPTVTRAQASWDCDTDAGNTMSRKFSHFEIHKPTLYRRAS